MRDLTTILQDYVSVLESDVPKNIYVSIFQSTFLDFIFRNRENIKGVIKLLDEFDNEDFIFLPLSSILRTISTDTLTVYYLMTFLSQNLKEDQITFENEVNSLKTESIRSMHKIMEYEKKLGLEDVQNINFDEQLYKKNSDGKRVLKNRKDFHFSSDPEVLNNYQNNSKFLSEEMKFKRVESYFENNDNFRRNIYLLFTNYKYISFYYHYTPIGGRLSRSFEISDFRRMQGIINTSIMSIIHIIGLLEFIDKETISKVKDCFEKINEYRIK